MTEPIIHATHETFGLWKRPPGFSRVEFDESSLMMIEINQRLAGRPDIIATEQYGSPLFEWIVIMFNRPLNPLGWPLVGTVITIPTETAVHNII